MNTSEVVDLYRDAPSRPEDVTLLGQTIVGVSELGLVLLKSASGTRQDTHLVPWPDVLKLVVQQARR